MRHIGFKNFRRFTDFPNMNFGDITILVGSNNSGKSTILKALMLVFDNIRNMRIVDRSSLEGENIFRFDGNHIHEVHVDTFGRALNKETSILGTIQFCPCFAVSGLTRACFCSKPA